MSSRMSAWGMGSNSGLWRDTVARPVTLRGKHGRVAVSGSVTGKSIDRIVVGTDALTHRHRPDDNSWNTCRAAGRRAAIATVWVDRSRTLISTVNPDGQLHLHELGDDIARPSHAFRADQESRCTLYPSQSGLVPSLLLRNAAIWWRWRLYMRTQKIAFGMTVVFYPRRKTGGRQRMRIL